MKLSVIIPALNEEESLPAVLADRLRHAAEEVRRGFAERGSHEPGAGGAPPAGGEHHS